MPTFTYKAIDGKGNPKTGKLEAPSTLELMEQLEVRGCYLVDASVKRSDLLSEKVYRGGVPARALIDFSHNLILILSSGIPIREGLLEMAHEIEHPGLRRTVEDIGNRINSGSTLAEALSAYPKIFPETYVNVVAAGETSGSLEEVLAKLVTYIEWREENKSIIIQASIYPAILCVAVTGLIILLLTFLLPRINGIFEQSSVELPRPTKMLMALSGFLVKDWPFLLAGLGVTGALFILLTSTKSGRYWLDRVKLRIPFFGELIRQTSAANFSYSLATMTHAGLSLPKALGVVGRVIRNKVLARAISDSQYRVEEGMTVAEAIKETNVFPPLVVRMVSIGEETGNLEESLGHATRYYDRVVPRTVKRFLAIVEPAIIVFAGAVVGFIVMCTLLPIFRLVKAIKG